MEKRNRKHKDHSKMNSNQRSESSLKELKNANARYAKVGKNKVVEELSDTEQRIEACHSKLSTVNDHLTSMMLNATWGKGRYGHEERMRNLAESLYNLQNSANKYHKSHSEAAKQRRRWKQQEKLKRRQKQSSSAIGQMDSKLAASSLEAFHLHHIAGKFEDLADKEALLCILNGINQRAVANSLPKPAPSDSPEQSDDLDDKKKRKKGRADSSQHNSSSSKSLKDTASPAVKTKTTDTSASAKPQSPRQ